MPPATQKETLTGRCLLLCIPMTIRFPDGLRASHGLWHAGRPSCGGCCGLASDVTLYSLTWMLLWWLRLRPPSQGQAEGRRRLLIWR